MQLQIGYALTPRSGRLWLAGGRIMSIGLSHLDEPQFCHLILGRFELFSARRCSMTRIGRDYSGDWRGEEPSRLWNWFRSTSPSLNTFDSFWNGDVGGYKIHETEKAGIHSLQESVRTQDELPGMLQVVRSPYLLTLALSEYCRNDSVPATRAGLVSAFLTTMLESARRTGLGVFDC